MQWEAFLLLVVPLVIAIAATVLLEVRRPALQDIYGQIVLARYNDYREAQERAEALLREVLGEHAYQQLGRQGFLEVPSSTFPGRVYRVPRSQGVVQVYEGGRLLMSLCVQPRVPLPDADVILMHKLMIEGNEEEYLRTANRIATVFGTHAL